MGIISHSSPDDNNINKEKIEEKKEPQEKEPKDSIKKNKNNKRPKNNTTKQKINSKKNISKNINTNKILKSKNNPGFSLNTFSAKRSNSRDKPNKEIKKIIFQNTKRNAISHDKNSHSNKKNKFKKQTEKRKHSINYKNFVKSDDEDDFDIIYNYDFSDESFEHQEQKSNPKKRQNKLLKEKINNTKKKIINLRKKLNTEINNSSKNINNKITNNFTIEHNNIKPNKISNTIFINNSNITISNTDRNYIKRRIIKKKNNNSVMSDYNSKYNYKNYNYNSNTYINPNLNLNQNLNLDLIEFDDLINNVFPSKINKINKNNNYQPTSNKKAKIKKKFFYTESDVNFKSINPNKENSTELSLSQYDKYINKKEDNKTIIYKMEELKEKIKSKINNDNKTTPSITRKTYPVFKNRKIKKVKSETMDNKHIKNNIPNYRRSYSRSNNIYNSTTNSLIESLDKKEKYSDNVYPKSLMNSNTKKKSMKNNYNFSFKRREKNKSSNISYPQDNVINNYNSINYKSIQLNHNSIKDLTKIDPITDINKIKNKKLYNIIFQNIIDNEENNNNIKTDNKDDINNIDQMLSVKYRDAIDLDISSINLKESLIDKSLIGANINNKIIFNFSKLENISTSQILFDGVIYKVVDNTINNTGKIFKIMERYFQVKKNCFRYFNNIQLARYNSDKPLVQFDIRHIKELKIIDNKIFDEYNLNGKKIEFSFAIFLNQNSDFFVFILDNKNFGNSLFSLMNLLKNYYEDKNNTSIIS